MKNIMSNDSITMPIANVSVSYMPTTSFISPKYDGYWVVGENFYIAIKKKPTEQQIKNTNELFGWEWKDGTQT